MAVKSVAYIARPPEIELINTLPVIQTALEDAQEITEVAGNMVVELAKITESIEAPQIDVPDLSIDDGDPLVIPTFGEAPPVVTGRFPVAPLSPTLASITFPNFGEPPDDSIAIPALNFGSKPSALSATIPQQDSLAPISIPSEPSYTLPTLPSLNTVAIPDIPTLDLPVFSDTLGDAPSSAIPTFSFIESEYTSTLLSALRTTYEAWVSGTATGIDPDVEDAIWNRGRDREAATFNSAQDQIYRDFAARGFALPAGVIVSETAKAREAFHGAVSTFNRDVAIKQAELEQSNRRFAMEQGFQLESMLVNYTSQMAQRGLEAAKFIVEAAIEVYKALVLQYNADVEAFKANAQVYGERIRGELAKVEIYKAEIEGAKLITDINEQTVRVYVAQLQGIEQMVKIYEATVRAAGVQSEINRNVIEGFKAQVQAYEAQVKAKASEYDAYATDVKAEVSKLEAPKIQADILRARTDGYAAKSRARADELNASIRLYGELPIQTFQAEVQAFDSSVRGVSSELDALTAIFDAQVKAFDSSIRGEAAKADVDVALVNARARIAEAEANIVLETARANILSVIETARMKIESARGAAAVMAQLAAGSMAGMSLSASASSSTSKSNSFGESASNSASNSFSAIETSKG